MANLYCASCRLYLGSYINHCGVQPFEASKSALVTVAMELFKRGFLVSKVYACGLDSDMLHYKGDEVWDAHRNPKQYFYILFCDEYDKQYFSSMPEEFIFISSTSISGIRQNFITLNRMHKRYDELSRDAGRRALKIRDMLCEWLSEYGEAMQMVKTFNGK